MSGKTKFYAGLAEVVGWISAIAFLLGAIGSLTQQEIGLSGNDYWQASLYLVFFAIFAKLMAKE